MTAFSYFHYRHRRSLLAPFTQSVVMMIHLDIAQAPLALILHSGLSVLFVVINQR